MSKKSFWGGRRRPRSRKWCAVREARAEVTLRRDQGTPTSFFASKSAAIWGCGALGGRVAEFLARAGIRKLVLRDPAESWPPGSLLRQPFRDQDIGDSKVHAIAELVRAIDPRIEVEVHYQDLLAAPLSGDDDWTEGVERHLRYVCVARRPSHGRASPRRTRRVCACPSSRWWSTSVGRSEDSCS